MNIHLIQSDIRWEDAPTNRAHLDVLIGQPEEGSLIVLPEMFNTGFTIPRPGVSESMAGETVQWMKQKAISLKCTITGSLIIEEEGAHYNRLCWVTEGGRIQHYDKRHLFRMAGEDQHFKVGRDQVTVDWHGLKVRLQICYDLRFPVWSRNQYSQELGYAYDLLIYVANWPAARHHAWEGLIRARAMENIAYCIGVNRAGKDGKGLDYLGGSVLIDPVGHPVLDAGKKEGNFKTELDVEFLRNFRAKFPVGLDADDFAIR